MNCEKCEIELSEGIPLCKSCLQDVTDFVIKEWRVENINIRRDNAALRAERDALREALRDAIDWMHEPKLNCDCDRCEAYRNAHAALDASTAEKVT